MQNKTLSKELDSLINPEPISIDIDNDGQDESTLATKIFEVNLNAEDRQYENPTISQIRRNQIRQLSSFDKRYSGKKIKRQDFIESFEHVDENIDEEEESIDDEDEYHSFDDEEDDHQHSDEDQSPILYDHKEPKQQNLNIMNDYNDELEMKAISVKNQLILYESLLNLRMKMQKILTLSNRLPLDLSILNNDERNMEMKNQSLKGIQKLQNIFLEMDDLICNNNDDGDLETTKMKKRKSTNSEKILAKRFCTLKQYYPEIIDEWHEKTKFVHQNINLKKFDSFNIRPSKIIDKILMDKERLINRTKIKRSQYKIIGNVEDDEIDDDGHIFDDDDFYQSLLRQIIESKTSNTASSEYLSSNKITEIQRLRNKSKKLIDTKASKGRKIRYDIHEKLVNFMAPLDRTIMEDDAKNDLFKSLFGNYSITQTTATTIDDL
ncbi:apoptosis antagonizing transcription factor [Dermatophagoides pteronyssinus]|uniref:apoptosis antagonizing transcription factor n=1 Tax=Dermatophagoides pteronyssinus TaxID=6956 RepID=UPI003F66C9D5